MPPRVHVVVFCTHRDGMYSLLESDARRYGIELVVLGWGTKWVSFFEKLRAVHEYTRGVHEDDLVVVIDAFDTRIRGGYAQIVEQWRGLGAPDVVFSKDPSLFPQYITNRVFGGSLNAGMYMGRAGPLAEIQQEAMRFEAQCKKDDQCAFNAVAQGQRIAVDSQRTLFYNLRYSERGRDLSQIESKAVFYGFPGSITFTRVVRAAGEYLPFFLPEISALVCLLVAIMLYRRYRRDA
tara:strand:+ start:2686 stop:3393 length:708 start_codon:yes stop_codon:yes gene_type:complete